MKRERFIIDLGNGHRLRWTTWEGEIVGGIIRHDMPKSEKFPYGFCEGAFWIKGNAFHKRGNVSESEKNHPQWEFNGDYQNPTLSPSFDCHCKQSHGFVRNGKWERA
jgi:hypothetical protein